MPTPEQKSIILTPRGAKFLLFLRSLYAQPSVLSPSVIAIWNNELKEGKLIFAKFHYKNLYIGSKK